jgi:hypothetical protein
MKSRIGNAGEFPPSLDDCRFARADGNLHIVAISWSIAKSKKQGRAGERTQQQQHAFPILDTLFRHNRHRAGREPFVTLSVPGTQLPPDSVRFLGC